MAAALLIAQGISAGASTAIAFWTKRVAQFAVVGLFVGGAIWLLRRRSRARAVSCGDVCAVDASCGCAANKGGASRGCALPREDAPDRMQAFLVLFDGGLRRTARGPDSVTFVFGDDEVTASRVHSLIEAERQCCSFLSFEVKREGGELRWTTRAGAEHADALDGRHCPRWQRPPKASRSPSSASA